MSTFAGLKQEMGNNRSQRCSYSDCENDKHSYKYSYFVPCSACSGSGRWEQCNSAGDLVVTACYYCLGSKGGNEQREAKCNYCENHCDGSSDLHPAQN